MVMLTYVMQWVAHLRYSHEFGHEFSRGWYVGRWTVLQVPKLAKGGRPQMMPAGQHLSLVFSLSTHRAEG